MSTDGATRSPHARHRLDDVIHAPVRFSIVATLAAVDEAEFALVRDEVDAQTMREAMHEAMDEAMDEAMHEAMGEAGCVAPPPRQPRPRLERIESRYVEVDWPDGDRCWLFEEAAGDPAQPVHEAGRELERPLVEPRLE